MKTFVVGYMNFFDSDLILAKVEATNWQEAIVKHPHFLKPEHREGNARWLAEMPDTIEEVKQFFFDSDAIVDVLELE